MSRADFDSALTEHVVVLRRYAFILTRKREDADDLVQETLAKAMTRADSWKAGTDLQAWLMTILHNTWISQIRKQRNWHEIERQLPADDLQPPAQEATLILDRTLLALENLPAAQREAVTLAAVGSLSHAEAAAVLGIPAGTFMSRLGRGRETLRRLLDDRNNDRSVRIIRGGRR